MQESKLRQLAGDSSTCSSSAAAPPLPPPPAAAAAPARTPADLMPWRVKRRNRDSTTPCTPPRITQRSP